jgi:hypothetical protein
VISPQPESWQRSGNPPVPGFTSRNIIAEYENVTGIEELALHSPLPSQALGIMLLDFRKAGGQTNKPPGDNDGHRRRPIQLFKDESLASRMAEPEAEKDVAEGSEQQQKHKPPRQRWSAEFIRRQSFDWGINMEEFFEGEPQAFSVHSC